MRRPSALLLLAPLLMAAEPCGGSRGDDPNFGGGGGSPTDGGGGDGGSSDGGSGDGGSSDGGSSDGGGGGGGGDQSFLSVEVLCEGDQKEYTWTYRALLSFQASYVTVEVDPGSSDYEAWYLEDQGGDGTDWAVQVTELLSTRSCDRPAELLWSAFGLGEWEETYESTYSP